MEDAIYVLVESFLFGMAGGGLAATGLRWASARRCSRLEWAVGDLQQRLSSMHGQKASKARWEQTQGFEQEMAQLMHKKDPPRKRYDNDPLGE